MSDSNNVQHVAVDADGGGLPEMFPCMACGLACEDNPHCVPLVLADSRFRLQMKSRSNMTALSVSFCRSLFHNARMQNLCLCLPQRSKDVTYCGFNMLAMGNELPDGHNHRCGREPESSASFMPNGQRLHQMRGGGTSAGAPLHAMGGCRCRMRWE